MKKMLNTFTFVMLLGIPFIHGGPGKAFGQAVANADKAWLVEHILGALGM
jgi:hypothetical protein